MGVVLVCINLMKIYIQETRPSMENVKGKFFYAWAKSIDEFLSVNTIFDLINLLKENGREIDLEIVQQDDTIIISTQESKLDEQELQTYHEEYGLDPNAPMLNLDGLE